ncbi:MAG: hypothetical protein LAO79_08865 [Acidobacteriia bacterium]|nr:hypothetical protein [Terriglobia bacterium]
MKLTRRAMAQMLAAAPAVSAAQTAPQTDAAKLAREQFDKNSQAMASVKIPIATEPPFHFKA